MVFGLFLRGWGDSSFPPVSVELRHAENGNATVIVHNSSTQSVQFTFPEHAVLTHPQLQDQMLLDKPRSLKLAPHGHSQFRSALMCVGQRQEATEGGGFQVSFHAHPDSQMALKVLRVCQELQSQGELPPMPMLAGNQVTVVAQWAYWAERGQVKKEDLSLLIHQELKPESKDEPEVQKVVDNTWEAIDLTRKQARQ